MATILLISHVPTASLQAVAGAVREGVLHPDLEGAVRLVDVPALQADVGDVRAADAVVLLTPVNFGYMSGALKHFFDHTYRRMQADGLRRPYLAVVKGTTDADGAVRAIEAITTGLCWPRVRPPVVVEGPADQEFLDRVREAASELAATLL